MKLFFVQFKHYQNAQLIMIVQTLTNASKEIALMHVFLKSVELLQDVKQGRMKQLVTV